jgi:hypothetical protein
MEMEAAAIVVVAWQGTGSEGSCGTGRGRELRGNRD